jgi:hypothetical protein
MKSNTMRVVAGIAVVAVAVLLFTVLKDDGKSASEKTDTAANAPAETGQPGNEKGKATPAVPTIVIKNGKPVGGITELTFNEGEQIRFKVDSDVSEEIHVHGYDIMKAVAAGGSVSFDFPASIEGVFEAEMEGRGVQIAELTINP